MLNTVVIKQMRQLDLLALLFEIDPEPDPSLLHTLQTASRDKLLSILLELKPCQPETREEEQA